MAEAFTTLRRAALRLRARAVVHHDRVMACIDGTAEHADRVATLYRTSFPSAFGPLQGRRAGDRTQES